MSAESQLYAILAADSGLAAIVGQRIYPDAMPEETEYPAVVFSRASTQYINTIHGENVAHDAEIVIQAWANDRTQAMQAAGAVTDALIAAKELPDSQSNAFDPDTGLYGAEIGVTIFVTD